MTVDELKKWADTNADVKTITDESNDSEYVFKIKYKLNTHTVRCNKSAAKSSTDLNQVMTYTADELKTTFGLAQDDINTYFEIVVKKGASERLYAIKSSETLKAQNDEVMKNLIVIYSTTYPERIEAYNKFFSEQYKKSVSIHNIIEQYLNEHNIIPVVTNTPEPVDTEEYIPAVLNNTNDVITYSVIQVLQKFSSGNMTVNELKTWANANSSVKDLTDLSDENRYKFQFKYNVNTYTIICDRVAAESSTDNIIVKTWTEDEIKALGIDNATRNKYFENVARRGYVSDKIFALKPDCGYKTINELLKTLSNPEIKEESAQPIVNKEPAEPVIEEKTIQAITEESIVPIIEEKPTPSADEEPVYDKSGYNQYGYDINGFDRNGVNKDGTKTVNIQKLSSPGVDYTLTYSTSELYYEADYLNGALDWLQSKRYDEYGNLLYEIQKYDNTTTQKIIDYKYDKQGNVTEAVVKNMKNGEIITEECQKITYNKDGSHTIRTKTYKYDGAARTLLNVKTETVDKKGKKITGRSRITDKGKIQGFDLELFYGALEGNLNAHIFGMSTKSAMKTFSGGNWAWKFLEAAQADKSGNNLGASKKYGSYKDTKYTDKIKKILSNALTDSYGYMPEDIKGFHFNSNSTLSKQMASDSDLKKYVKTNIKNLINAAKNGVTISTNSFGFKSNNDLYYAIAGVNVLDAKISGTKLTLTLFDLYDFNVNNITSLKNSDSNGKKFDAVGAALMLDGRLVPYFFTADVTIDLATLFTSNELKNLGLA